MMNFAGFDKPSFSSMSNPRQDLSNQMTDQTQKKPWWTALISELGGGGGAAGGAAAGAAIGSVVPVVGTAVGGLIGAGLGGFLGGTGGRLVENKVRDNQFKLGSALKEGAVSGALSGVGEGISGGVKALKAVKGGVTAAEALGRTGTGAAIEDSGSLLQNMSKSLKSSGVGALDLKQGINGVSNEATRLATAKQYNIASGLRGLRQTESLVGNLETKIQPLLQNTQVPVKTVFDAIDSAAGSTFSPVAESPALVENLKGVVLNHSNGNVLSGDALRTVRSELGNVFKKNTIAPIAGLQKDIYHSLGDVLGESVPKAKALITEQGKLFNVAEGLQTRAAGAHLPILNGIGGKSRTVGIARDAGTDLLSGVTGVAGRVTANPIVKQLVRQDVPRAIGKLGQSSQPDQAGQNSSLLSPLNQGDATSTSPNNLLNTSGDQTSSLLGQANGDVTSQLLGQAAPQQSGGPSLDSLRQAIAEDVQQTGGKNVDNLMLLGKLYGLTDKSGIPGGGQVKLTAPQQARKDALASALGSLDTVGTTLPEAGGAQGLKGELGKIPWAGKFLDPQGAAYTNTKVELATQLAKAITGGSRAPESVINKYMHSLPDINDTPEYAAAKLNKLKEELYGQARRFGYTDLLQNTSSGTSSLLSQLNGQGQ